MMAIRKWFFLHHIKFFNFFAVLFDPLMGIFKINLYAVSTINLQKIIFHFGYHYCYYILVILYLLSQITVLQVKSYDNKIFFKRLKILEI